MEEPEELTISEGALIVSSRCPTGAGNIHRESKDDSIWVPQISIIKPHNAKLFFSGSSLRKEGLPFYVNHPDGSPGFGLWYVFKEHLSDLTAVSYLLIPGEIKNSDLLERRIHNLPEGFVSDEKDSIQEKEPVGIFAVEDNLEYSFTHCSYGVNSRVEDIPKCLYYLLNGMKEKSFGYSCEHSGSIGLSPKLNGNLNLSRENIYDSVSAIGLDFKKRLEAKVLS